MDKNKLFKLLELKKNFGFDLSSKQVYDKQKSSRNYNCRNIKNFSDFHLTEHFSGMKTYALSLFKHSRYIVVDVDGRSNDKNTKDIVDLITKEEFFGDCFFSEYSNETDGYHLYFHYDKFISKARAKAIEGYFRDMHKFDVEVKVKGDRLRLPFSGSYEPCNHMSIEEAFSEANCFPVPLTDFLEKFLDPTLEVISGSQIDLENHSSDNLGVDFSYGCGTRSENQLALGFHLLNQNPNTSFDYFVEQCEFWNDGTSKDMKLPEKQRLKVMKYVWTYCLKKHNPFKKNSDDGSSSSWVKVFDDGDDVYTEFHINEDFFFEDEDYVKLDKVLNYYYSKLKVGKKGGKTHKRFIRDCTFVLEFLHSTKEYRDERGYEYKNEDFKPLEKGVPFGLKLQRTLAKYYSISNIKKIIKFLQDCSLINLIYLDNGYTYSYSKERYSKHYLLNSLYKLYYNLLSLIKSSYKSVYKNLRVRGNYSPKRSSYIIYNDINKINKNREEIRAEGVISDEVIGIIRNLRENE